MRTLHTLLAAAILLPTIAFGASLGEIKQNMAKRLPALNQLKKQQAIGENNQALLEILAKDKLSKENKALVTAENKDREAVYNAIAASANTTVELVKKRRAAQIRQQSAPGIMVQTPDGTWQPKKAE